MMWSLQDFFLPYTEGLFPLGVFFFCLLFFVYAVGCLFFLPRLVFLLLPLSFIFCLSIFLGVIGDQFPPILRKTLLLPQ